MNKIVFFKYTSNGNNFVLLDESHIKWVAEEKKSQFSKRICNEATGIGCDSLIILQKYDEATLQDIYGVDTGKNKNKHTLELAPEYIMRVFERDGSESLCCGNGLICLGYHLLRLYSVDAACIATEIPSSRIVTRSIRTIGGNKIQANMGKPILSSIQLVNPDRVKTIAKSSAVHILQEIAVPVGINNHATMLNCYITFTGEPHLVVFINRLINPACQEIFSSLFCAPSDLENLHNGDHLINQIGRYFNSLKEYFPQGINVSFVKLLDENRVAYRCFERGVNHETYACGTAATAVASVIHELGLIEDHTLRILPWRARRNEEYRDNEIILVRDQAEYKLSAEAIFLAEGEYYSSVIDKKSDSMSDHIQIYARY